MRIALVYDRVNKFGGAERVLLALHEIWPHAPLFTAVYNPKRASWAKVFAIKTSFLQHIPFASERHELFPLLTPLAFESFDFSQFDVVLSITSAEAKGIITKPSTLHICYCLTPTRYLWSGYHTYLRQPGLGVLNPLARLFMQACTPSLRVWDSIASQRVDRYIAISKRVKERIEKYYRKRGEIIYPPVDTDTFTLTTKKSDEAGDFFLIVSRLVPYKRIDYVIAAFRKLKWKLIIIGSGIDEGRLKRMAQSNIEFINGDLTDQKLCWYYQNCRALLFAGEEDFGLTAVEVQACGRPVIAFSQSGVAESIRNGVTGQLYHEQNEASLTNALRTFQKRTYMPDACRRNALHFRKTEFKKQMKNTIERLWQEWNKRV